LTLMEARFKALRELTPIQSESSTQGSGAQNGIRGWSEEGSTT